MQLNMAWQVRPNNESFPTEVADIRFLTGVGSSHVDCQAIIAWEIFPTYFTKVRFLTCVRSDVDPQSTALFETFAAYFASIRLLTCVGPYMYV